MYTKIVVHEHWFEVPEDMRSGHTVSDQCYSSIGLTLSACSEGGPRWEGESSPHKTFHDFLSTRGTSTGAPVCVSVCL